MKSNVKIMKKSSFLVIGLLWMALILGSYHGVFAQQITEEDKTGQEEVLKEDPRDFAANFVVGAYYYNKAIPPHKETTEMNLIQYLDEGKSYEDKKEDFLKKSLPYFENAYTIKKDVQVKEVLKNIYQNIGMLPTFRVTPEELDTLLEEKLNELEFKEIK
jgi:hypothetical protein